MHKTVFAWQKVNKSTKVDDANHGTLVDGANLGLSNNAFDFINSRLQRGVIDRVDLDRAIVVDIHRCARLFGDGADGSTALTDDVTDFIWVNFDGFKAWRIVTNTVA